MVFFPTDVRNVCNDLNFLAVLKKVGECHY